MSAAILARALLPLTFIMGSCAAEPATLRAQALSTASTPKEAKVPSTEHDTSMIEGASLNPTPSLLTWLEESAKRGDDYALMRLPVVLRVRPDKLGLSGAHIGAQPGEAPEGAIELDLNDTALSVGLWEQLQRSEALDPSATAIWLEGYWRELLPMPSFGGLDPGPKTYPFDVRGIGGPVDPATERVLISP